MSTATTGGFNFCGHDIAEFNLEYAPDMVNTYVWQQSKYDIHEESFAAHHGGYYYGATVKPKDFVLRCIFQSSNINDNIISNIEQFFSRGKVGKLFFAKRPWIYYIARVIQINIQPTNYLNGFITINMRAYFPFGRYDKIYLNEDDDDYSRIQLCSGLISSDIMPECNIYSGNVSFSMNQNILLYNGGTEYAPVAVEIAGDVGDGFDIINNTTGEKMSFVALTKNVTTNVNMKLVCDSLNGKTILTDGVISELSFLYHDSGFLSLAPSTLIKRNVAVECTGTSATFIDGIDEDQIGKFIYVNNKWCKIKSIENNIATIDKTASGSYITPIVTMNEITLHPRSTVQLSWLNFVYLPTFA